MSHNGIAFCAVYVFYEKKRLLEDNPKSKRRREMEGVHPRGLDVSECMDRIHFLQRRGRRMVKDKYGRLT